MPARLDAAAKERLRTLVDEAVARGWSHTRACAVLEVADVRMHRWRRRLREHQLDGMLAQPNSSVACRPAHHA